MLSKEMSKKDLFNLLEFTNNTLDIDTEDRFIALLNGMKIFIPFQYAICGLVKIHKDNSVEVIAMLNLSYPSEWMDLYLKKKYVFIDPIMQTHFSEFRPQIWKDTYKRMSNKDDDFMYISSDFGLLNGVTYGLNDKKAGLISLFSFSELQEEPSNRHLQFLKTLVPHLHQLIIRLSKENKVEKIDNPVPKVSPREKEVLTWIHQGKTNWETSMILNISERTVKFHVSNLIDKLNAVSRGHVVAKALEFGII